MGPLLSRLLAKDEGANAANPANPANPWGAGGSDSQIRKIRKGPDAEPIDKHGRGFADSQDSQSLATEQSARLAAALNAEGLPPELLALDDAEPADLAPLSDEALRAYALALHCTAEREAGRIPPGWDHPAQCDGCGSVWLWTPAHVAVCPWCWNRRAGKSVPRPAPGDSMRSPGLKFAGFKQEAKP